MASFIPEATIRQKAQDLLAAASIDRPPVPPDSVARAAGVRVVMDSLSAELSGVLRVLAGAPTIVVNSSHGEMRRRFAIAHKLGHRSLHGGREGSQMFVDRDFVFRRGQKAVAGSDREEIQVNMFAAELLMPRAWLERDVGRKGHRRRWPCRHQR